MAPAWQPGSFRNPDFRVGVGAVLSGTALIAAQSSCLSLCCDFLSMLLGALFSIASHRHKPPFFALRSHDDCFPFWFRGVKFVLLKYCNHFTMPDSISRGTNNAEYRHAVGLFERYRGVFGASVTIFCLESFCGDVLFSKKCCNFTF